MMPGDIVRVSPRWGGPVASAHRWVDHKVFDTTLPVGELLLVTQISSGGMMIHIRRSDGGTWCIDKADLLPFGEAADGAG